MSTSRPRGKGVAPFWLSLTNAKNEPFSQFGVSLFQAKQFQALSLSTRYVYLCMALEAKGNKKFEFPLSVANRYNIANTTLRNAVKDLKAAGFIKATSGKTTRTPTSYEFDRTWKTPP